MRMLLALTLLIASGGITAQGVVIYRCTDASGALTVQNDVPCPSGQKQERRVIDAPPPPTPVAPAVVRRPPAVPAAASADPAAAPSPADAPAGEPAVADADRLPPPPLFECRTYSNDRYLSDDGAPPQRCARLQTTGLDGSTAMGAGTSCEMVDDQCQQIADGALCENWRQRLLQAESLLRFGRGDQRAQAQADVERVGRIVRESVCGI